MSLDFNLTAMRDRVGETEWERLTTRPGSREAGSAKWHPVTDSLVWLSLSIDLSEIKESNIDEWVWRVAVAQRTNDLGTLQSIDETFYISREDIENHIGLSTNVSRRSRKDFINKVIQHFKNRNHHMSIAEIKEAGDAGLMPNRDGLSAHDIVEANYQHYRERKAAS